MQVSQFLQWYWNILKNLQSIIVKIPIGMKKSLQNFLDYLKEKAPTVVTSKVDLDAIVAAVEAKLAK